MPRRNQRSRSSNPIERYDPAISTTWSTDATSAKGWYKGWRSSGCLGTNLDIQLEPVEINDDIGAFYAGTPVVKGYGNDFRRGVVVGARRTGPGEHDSDAIVLFDESDGELSDEGNGSVASSSRPCLSSL